MADILSIGTSALTSLQRAISTTGHNIANVNTDGYSKQSVNFVANQPEYTGVGALGTGVSVGSVSRSYDQFLTADVQNKTASSHYFSNLAQTAGRVDELLADPATSVASAMDTFFASMEAVANSPTSLPERQVMLAEAETLAQRFQYLDARLDDFAAELNSRIEVSTSEINQLSQTIADLNDEIAGVSARSGLVPNDLLDQRDLAVTELSALVKTTTQTQDDGALNVFIGRGQPLVIGSRAEQMTAIEDPLNDNTLQIVLTSGGNAASDVTNFMTGGKLGAALDASDNVIESTRRDLGLLAVGVAETFNAQHALGDDLNGVPGGTFFVPMAPTVTGDDNNGAASVVSAQIVDVAQLTGDSYQLDYAGGAATLRNLTTGLSQPITGTSLTIDGVQIDFTAAGAASDGDSFLIEPTAQGARLIRVAIDDPAAIAAAASGANVGDNSNLLALIDLREANTLKAGNASYYDVYNGVVTDVAVQTRRANSSATTESALLSSAQERQSSLQGVNLEEEAANLIRYQQAYQAAAQIIATANEAFDTLLRATSR